MLNKNWCVVILAAGKGKRMNSELPKVLHEVAGRSMIVRVCNASEFVSNNIVVVIGHKSELVKEEVKKEFDAVFAFQKQQNGTGDAVRSAVDFIDASVDNIMVLCGDSPLIKGETLLNFAYEHEKENNTVSVLAMKLDNPYGYGRLITKGSRVQKIVEEADADELQKHVKIVNSGVYCFEKKYLMEGLKKLKCNNMQKEYYLTDIVGFASLDCKEKVGFHILKNAYEAMGVNSPEELEKAESLLVSELSLV